MRRETRCMVNPSTSKRTPKEQTGPRPPSRCRTGKGDTKQSQRHHRTVGTLLRRRPVNLAYPPGLAYLNRSQSGCQLQLPLRERSFGSWPRTAKIPTFPFSQAKHNLHFDLTVGHLFDCRFCVHVLACTTTSQRSSQRSWRRAKRNVVIGVRTAPAHQSYRCCRRCRRRAKRNGTIWSCGLAF